MRAHQFAPLLVASLAWGAEPPPPVPAAPPVAPAAATTPEEDATLAQLRAELDALKAQVASQATALEQQKKDLDAQRQGLAAERLKDAGNEPPFKLEVTGYYRARGYVFGTGGEKKTGGALFASQQGPATYMDQRLRMGLKFAYKSVASANVHLSALDGVVFGDNASLERTSLFAGDPSDTTISGAEAVNVKVFRAWAEARLPLGIVRIGRQSSHWGLGILANHGDGFDDDFGENRYGNTYDRFLFATNPVSIVQAITKKQERTEIPLRLAIAVDRLVEDPLIQYYGYKCSPGDVQGADEDYDTRCDADGNGTTDLDHGYTADRVSSQRTTDWWANRDDDVWEMVYALIYQGVDLDWFGGKDDFTAGTYIIQRLQKETDSNVVIADLYLDAKIRGVIAQFEGVGIWGTTRALTLPNSADAEDPLLKTPNIGGYVARVGYEQPKWKVLMESGLASGDSNVTDGKFTGRALSPDYNVGLLLYEEVLARVTEEKWAGDARGLRSKGGVYNSHYIFPRVYGMPMDNWQFIGGFLMGWPHKPDGAVIRCAPEEADELGCTGTEGVKPGSPLGWEVDLAVKHRFHKHILFSLEAGYAHATNRVSYDTIGLNPKGNFFTVQSRLAWEF